MLIALAACSESVQTNARVQRLPYYNEASFTPHWIEPDSPELNDFHRVHNFSLLNQDSAVVSAETVRSKIFVADFFFTACGGICPKMTKNMTLLQESYLNDEEVLLLSHSVMPSADSVATLQHYAQINAIQSTTWHLLTGPKSEIYDLGRSVYFIEEDLGTQKSDDDFLHTENFVLVDKHGHIRGIYNGLRLSDIEQIKADIALLKTEG